MSNPGETSLEAALDWLIPESNLDILTMGVAASPTARKLSRAGHRLTLVDANADQLAKFSPQLPGITTICSEPQRLPFAACSFSTVLLSQTLGPFIAPKVLNELARILRPGGKLCVHFAVRDDSVPWVRRLAEIMRRADPNAMTTGRHREMLQELAGSKRFKSADSHDFRLWVPMAKAKLLAQVEDHPAVAAVEERSRAELTQAVSDLYDSYSRPPQPLLLPYQVACWKAEVNYDRFAAPARQSPGFQISF